MLIGRLGTIVSTNWLRDCLSTNTANKLRVLDASWSSLKQGIDYEKIYLKKHIPDALYFDLSQCSTPTKYIPLALPDSNCLGDYIGSLGICKKTHVVFYDQDDTMSAVRAWWLFKYVGHSTVSVLDGGLTKWLTNGYEVTSKPTTVEKCDYECQLQPNLLRDFDAILKNTKTQAEQIVDSRPAKDFNGSPEDKNGHIPHSKNIPYPELFNKDGTFKSEIELKAMFDGAGIDLDKPLATTCQLGVTACGLVAVAELLGKEGVGVYAGSWNEFVQRDISEN